MAIRLNHRESYRCETYEEAKAFIQKIKDEAADGGYEVTATSARFKKKKKGGEIIDQGYLIEVTKEFSDFWDGGAF